MSRRGRPSKTSQQIKEEQINFLSEDVEKNLEEYKEAIDLKEKQLSTIYLLLTAIRAAIKWYLKIKN